MHGPPPSAPAGRWGLGDALVGIVVGYALSLVAFVASGWDARTAPLWQLAVLQIPFWGGLVGAVWSASRHKGSSSLRRDFGLEVRRGDWVGLPIGAFTQWPVVALLYLPFLLLFDDLDVAGPARDLTDRASGAGIVVLALVVVVGAPVVEELFFRGLVLRSLERRFAPRVALVVSALLFAAFHWQGIQTPALVVFGLVAGWLAQRRGRLGAAIAAHMGFNAVTVVVLLATR